MGGRGRHGEAVLRLHPQARRRQVLCRPDKELKERLCEHKDGVVPSTAGQTPRLAWFHVVPTRHEAVSLEAEVKDVAESSQREIRRLVVGFRDLVREVDLD